MTFCTACASPLDPTVTACPVCGEGRDLATAQCAHASPPSQRPILVRCLYIAPILLVFAVAGGFVQRHTSEQEWLASAYVAAEDAAIAGDLVSARDGFAAIAGYRDATSRATEMETQLEPLQADYIEGLRAIERGEYAEAVALLAPVAEQAPGLEDVVIRLDDARRLLAGDLRRDVDAAETVHNWPEAERLLRELVNLDPDDASARERLASLQREHGPIVLGNDRALWIVEPDGSEPRQITDALHVIWPVWRPDRTQIAFLAPDPDDPMGNTSLYRIALDGSGLERLADGVSAHAPPSWSPDGSRIAYTSFAAYDPVYETGHIGVRVFDLESGEEYDVTGDEHLLAFNPAWSPDGTKIAFIVKHQGLGERPQHAPGDVVVTTLGSGSFENLTEGAVRDVWSVAWSPLGEDLLLYSLFGQTWYEPPSTSIRMLDLPTGEIDQIAGIDVQPTTPVWSPDGTRFAFTAREKTIVLSDPEGNMETLDSGEPLSGELTWSPDGTALLLAPWDADSSTILLDLSGPERDVSSVSFEFDASPPFISPPQWAPAVALPPAENPSLPPPDASEEAAP